VAAAGAPAASELPASRPAISGPIKVGVTLSLWTADTNSPSGKP
jgi:hypothetical protein